MNLEISVQELKAELESGRELFLLDVRESDELEICQLPGVVHIPLAELPTRTYEIAPESDVVVICRTGGRSGRATQFLAANGYDKVRNMVGGMHAWADAFDPMMPKY